MEYEWNVKDKGPKGPSKASGRWSTAAVVGTMLIGATAGCERDGPPNVPPGAALSAHMAAATPPARTLNLQDAPGASLGKYRMYWPKRGQVEVNDRITKVAAVLRQKKVSLVSPSAVGRDFARPLDDNKLEVAYDGSYDSMWVRDEALAKAVESPSDIGEKKAQSAMKDAFNDLIASGLVESRHYDLGDIRPSHHYLRKGSDDGSPIQEMVVEYRFRVLRKLNGIEVPNSGILIGIAPSGQRSTIKMGGVEIDSTYNGVEERPGQVDSVIARKVANADISKRFEKEVSPGNEKRVSWNKLMYVMPEEASEAIVEPTMVYRISDVSVGPSGEASLAPAKLYSFSLSDQSIPAVDLFPRQ